MCADIQKGRHAVRCSHCQGYGRRDGYCRRCDLTTPPLPGIAEIVTRYCYHCGRAYQTYGGSPRLVCSNRCNNARWRAIGKLAGTHGSVNGRWKRLKVQPDV